ncbi:MAG: copper homeostasis membrane protein CopD [Pseudomonas sp.]
MDGLFNIFLRFANYTDLMLLFGLANFGLYGLKGDERTSGSVFHFNPLLASMAALGLLFSSLGIFVTARAVSGASNFSALIPQLKILVLDTDIGLAWIIRCAALTVVFTAALLNRHLPLCNLIISVVAGGIALASLAWGGHGAMDEGQLGAWHLAVDILHLVSASSWIGALAAFWLLLRGKSLRTANLIPILTRSLGAFAFVGSAIVAVIIFTGVSNYLFIGNLTRKDLVMSLYGRLLLIKLTLFAGMLAIATLNRWYLRPLLLSAIGTKDYASAVEALRRSITFEFSIELLILALVAWLGTVDPGVL